MSFEFMSGNVVVYFYVLSIAVILVAFCCDNFRSERYGRREFRSTIQSARATREHYRQEVRVNMPLGTRANREVRVDMPLDTRSEIARCAIRALPPVKTFNAEQVNNCPICMEQFKKGELIQPFSSCAHEFHSSCLNSWLLGGKTTCPVCRQDLSTNTSRL